MTPLSETIILHAIASHASTNAHETLKTSTNCSIASAACCSVRAARIFAARALASSHAVSSTSVFSSLVPEEGSGRGARASDGIVLLSVNSAVTQDSR